MFPNRKPRAGRGSSFPNTPSHARARRAGGLCCVSLGSMLSLALPLYTVMVRLGVALEPRGPPPTSSQSTQPFFLTHALCSLLLLPPLRPLRRHSTAGLAVPDWIFLLRSFTSREAGGEARAAWPAQPRAEKQEVRETACESRSPGGVLLLHRSACLLCPPGGAGARFPPSLVSGIAHHLFPPPAAPPFQHRRAVASCRLTLAGLFLRDVTGWLPGWLAGFLPRPFTPSSGSPIHPPHPYRLGRTRQSAGGAFGGRGCRMSRVEPSTWPATRLALQRIRVA